MAKVTLFIIHCQVHTYNDPILFAYSAGICSEDIAKILAYLKYLVCRNVNSTFYLVYYIVQRRAVHRNKDKNTVSLTGTNNKRLLWSIFHKNLRFSRFENSFDHWLILYNSYVAIKIVVVNRLQSIKIQYYKISLNRVIYTAV